MNTLKKKVYLAGKITGEDYQECWDKFELYENILLLGGFDVINPMRIVQKGTHWQDAMDMLKPHFIQCKHIFFMGDWTQSEGARLEMEWANENHIPVVYHFELEGFISHSA